MTYSGSLALRLAGAEELIARCVSFRSKVGAGNIADAKDRIYAGEVTLLDVLEMLDGGTLKTARPAAVIGVQQHTYQQIGQGSAIVLGATGGVWVLFIGEAEQPNSHKLSLLAFCDWVSQVTDELSRLVGQDIGATDYTLWPFNGVRMFLDPLRPDVADRKADDYWVCGYVLTDEL